MNFSDIANTDRYYIDSGVRFWSLVLLLPKKLRGNEDELPLSIIRLGRLVHSCVYAATILSMAKRAMIPCTPSAYVSSLFAYVASPLKRKGQRDMAKLQRIQASKKRRLEMTFHTEELRQLG